MKCATHSKELNAVYEREEFGKVTTLMECGQGCAVKCIVDGHSYKYEESKDGVVTEQLREMK